jgi:hypothetical protein
MKHLIFTRGRQRTDRYDGRFQRAAEEFVEKHKGLFAELFFGFAREISEKEAMVPKL